MLKDGVVAETPAAHGDLIDAGGEYSKLWAGRQQTLTTPLLLLPLHRAMADRDAHLSAVQETIMGSGSEPESEKKL